MEIVGILLEIIPHFSDFLGDMVDVIFKANQNVLHSFVFILTFIAIGKALEFLLLKVKEKVSAARMHQEAGGQSLFAKWKETLIFGMCNVLLNIFIIIVFKYGGKLLLLYLFVTRLLYRVLTELFYPAVVAPKLVRSTPLPQGTMKRRILLIVRQLGYPVKDVVVVENAKRDVYVPIIFLSSKISDRRIAISQRLIDKNDPAMIYALVIHHVVHWTLYHHLICFVISEVHCVLEFTGFVVVMRATKILYELSSAYGLATSPVPSPSLTLSPRLSPGFSPLPPKTSDMRQVAVVIETLVFQFLYKRYEKLLRSLCSIFLGILEAKAEGRAQKETDYEDDAMRRYYNALVENELDRAETLLPHISFDNGPPSLVDALSNCVDSVKLE